MFRKLASLLAVGLLAMPPRAFALGSSGFSTQLIGARALGQGNAFVAEADDASAAYFNPAGLTQLSGSQLSAGATIVTAFTKKTGNDLADEHMTVNPGTLPNLYSTFSLPSLGGHKMSAGISWNSPFGLSTEWQRNSSLRYVTTVSKFQMYTLNPSIAFEATPKLSLAAGADYVRLFDIVAEAQTPNAPGEDDGSSRLTGHGSGWGYNVGALFKPTEKHAFGVTYRSQVHIPITGSLTLSNISPSIQDATFGYNFAGSNYMTGAHSSLTLPASVLGGYAFRPNAALTLVLDYEWTQWNVFQNQDVALDESDPQRLGYLTAGAGPNANVARTPRQWHNTSAVGVGANYKINPAWEVRGGYAFYEKTVPNDTFSPDVPDASNHFISAGITRNWESWSLDLALASFIYANRSVSNTVGSATGSSVNGTYKTFAPVVALNANYKFGGNR